MKKLLVLTADIDMENAVRGLLSRHKSIGFAPVDCASDVDFVHHPNHDAGCYLGGAEFLRYAVGKYEHAIVLFDHEGSGREQCALHAVERDVEKRLLASGWQSAGVVVLEPELESWVWSASPKVAEELGWKTHIPSLREWLIDQDFLEAHQIKPSRPKEAMEAALQHVRKPRSPRIYENIARKVSLLHCKDESFLKLKTLLCQWFPVPPVPQIKQS